MAQTLGGRRQLPRPRSSHLKLPISSAPEGWHSRQNRTPGSQKWAIQERPHSPGSWQAGEQQPAMPCCVAAGTGGATLGC